MCFSDTDQYVEVRHVGRVFRRGETVITKHRGRLVRERLRNPIIALNDGYELRSYRSRSRSPPPPPPPAVYAVRLAPLPPRPPRPPPRRSSRLELEVVRPSFLREARPRPHPRRRRDYHECEDEQPRYRSPELEREIAETRAEAWAAGRLGRSFSLGEPGHRRGGSAFGHGRERGEIVAGPYSHCQAGALSPRYETREPRSTTVGNPSGA